MIKFTPCRTKTTLPRMMLGIMTILLTLVASTGLGAVQPVSATSHHTITIDGTEDFADDEDFSTSSTGYTAYATWDANNLYLGYSGSDVGSDESDKKWIVWYIDTDPKCDPDTGNGTTNAASFNTQDWTLPFNADYFLQIRTDEDFNQLNSWNASAWQATSYNGTIYDNDGDNFIELSIPLNNIGSPTKIRILGYFINETGGYQWTYASWPDNSLQDGDGYKSSGEFSAWYGFTLVDGVAPDAPANYNQLFGPVANTDTGETFCTIQAAIDDAQTLDGHTVNVAAGTYIEDPVIDKALTLLGPNEGFNPNTDTRVAEAIVQGSTASGLSEFLNLESTNVVIKGFTFDNLRIDNYNSSTQETIVGDVIENNIFSNVLGTAIYLRDGRDAPGSYSTGVSVQNNKITAPGSAGTVDYNAGSGIIVMGAESSTISGNVISSAAYNGIQLARCNGMSITGNTATGAAQPALQIAQWNDGTFTINGNTFSTLSTTKAAVRLYGFTNNYYPEFNFTDNTFQDSKYAVQIGHGDAGKGYNDIRDADYSFTGNTFTNIGTYRLVIYLSTAATTEQMTEIDTLFAQTYAAGSKARAITSADPFTYAGEPSEVWVDDGYTAESCGGHIWGYDAFTTIQGGINAVIADGTGTVNVSAGTYQESDITINKALTLSGAGQASTFIVPDPSKVDDATCSPTGGTVHHGIIVAANNVTIEDLTIDGGTDRGYRMGITSFYWTGGNFDNTTIQDVTVTNIHYRGIVIRRNGALTTGHKVLGATVTHGGCDDQGFGILGFNVDQMEIKDNYVAEWKQGIATGNYTGTPSRCDIQDNEVKDVDYQAYTLTLNGAGSVFDGNTAIFTNPANQGMGLVTYQDEITLTNNTFTGAMYGISVGYQTLAKDKLVIGAGNVVTGPGTNVAGSIGIDVSDYSWGGAARNFTMMGTTVTGYETGIWFNPQSGMTSDALINGNQIIGNAVGLRNDLAGIQVDATLNWWGAASGPAAGQISGDVLYCPWLDDVPGVGDPLSGVVTNADTTETFCSIQAAIDDADTDTGDTINVSAGTYAETVTVNKDITLQGVNAPDGVDAAVINGRITVSAAGATVQQLKIAPGAVTDDAAAIFVTASNTTVANNLIDGMTGDGSGTIKGIHVYDGSAPAITTIALTGNIIENIHNPADAPYGGAVGIMVQGVVDGVTVTENEINGITSAGWAYGIEVSPTGSAPTTPPQNVTVTNNIVSSVNPGYSNPSVPPYPGVGLIIGYFREPDPPNTVYPANASEVTASGNSFSSTPAPLVNSDATNTLNGSGNYLGYTAPDILKQAIPLATAGLVDYTPWLASSTDTSTDPGFQGDFSTLWVDDDSPQTGAVGRIQEGIDLVSGSTVNVAEGTYNEEITLNKTGLLVVSQGAITLSGGSLGFTKGLWVLGAHNLSLASGVTVSGGSATAMVVADGAGALCRAYDSSGTFTFPIGDRTGDTEYSPATLNFTSGTFSSGQACVRVTDAAHPGYTTLPTAYISRYWTVMASGITSFSANAAFTYLDADVEGTETMMTARKVDGATWLAGPAVNAGANTFAMDVTGFSDFTAGSNNPTAVFLSSFTALPEGEGIRVVWETASELQNLGFNLYRGESPAGPWVKLNAELIPAQNPGAVFGASYEWLDSEVIPDTTVYYRLEDVDASGVSTFHGPVSAATAGVTAVRVTAFGAHGTAPAVLLLTLATAGVLTVQRKRRRAG